MKKLLVIFFLINHAAFGANTALSPSELILSVYKLAISTSPLCTNPITVFDNSTPTEVNFLSAPSLGSGTVADGTYPCIMIEFSDNIKFRPSSTSDASACVSGTQYTVDVCNASSSTSFTLINGTTRTCDNTNQRVAMYLSTASSTVSGNANAFVSPTTIPDATKGFKLSSALVVSGTSSGKFIVNGTGKVCDPADASCNGAGCQMEPPLFSFSKI